MANFKKEFHEAFKSGDKISVTLPKYCHQGEYARVDPTNITKSYTIGRTDLDESQGQVELLYGNRSMVVEYQWFDEELTSRKINKVLT